MKFFQCNKCGNVFTCSIHQARPEMMCGTVVQYLPAENPEVGNKGPIKSLGLKPIGCGGKMEEITQEEAMNYDPRK